MKNTLVFLMLCYLVVERVIAQSIPYTVIVNPGEKASNEIRMNWHTDLGSGKSSVVYTEVQDRDWKKAKVVEAQQEICLVFDSIYSKKANGEDFFEEAKFLRNTISIQGLKPDTKYQYKIVLGDLPNNGNEEVRYFNTAPKKDQWTMGIISDMHVYAPLPNRQKAGMGMVQQLQRQNVKPFNMMLHVGDLSAWGGSYSFWPMLYADSTFRQYVWAGVNGNHDDMTRKHDQSNAFFRNVNNNPTNGYGSEVGVSYFFIYGNTLFIMLNNEVMKSEEGLAEAQRWVRNVVKDNPAKYVVVVSHYQWFMGGDGRSSQYSRWSTLFDELGVDLAISGNNHIYVRTNALFAGKETDGAKGTVYIQTPSSDNERGQEMGELLYNKDIIKSRWTEGNQTIGGLILRAKESGLSLMLFDRDGNVVDEVKVRSKR